GRARERGGRRGEVHDGPVPVARWCRCVGVEAAHDERPRALREALPVQLGGDVLAVDREGDVETVTVGDVLAREREGRDGGQERVGIRGDGALQVHGSHYAPFSARWTWDRACSTASSSVVNTCAECWSSSSTPAASTMRRWRGGRPLRSTTMPLRWRVATTSASMFAPVASSTRMLDRRRITTRTSATCVSSSRKRWVSPK